MKKRVSDVMVTFLIGVLVCVLFPHIANTKEPEESIECQTGLYYTVQEGDTLWDISKQFYDTPVWPEVWKDNEYLHNPHWIYPGQRIEIYYREDVDNGDDTTISKQPSDQETGFASKQPDTHSSLDDQSIMVSYIDRVGFIRDEPIQAHGKIFQANYNRQMISQGDLVYIEELSDTPLTMGGRYTVYRLKDVTYTNHQGIRMRAKHHYVAGIVEIIRLENKNDIERLKSDAQTQPLCPLCPKALGNYALAKVTKSFQPILMNDYLTPYTQRSPQIALKQGVTPMEGTILLTEEDNQIFGDNTVAYIDKGESDNIQVGQVYSLFQRESRFFCNENCIMPRQLPEPMFRLDTGHMVVIHTEPHTSTILIRKTKNYVQPGGMFYASGNTPMLP